MSHTVELDAPVAAERLFDYLSDPWTRPDWQSSLRTVVDVSLARYAVVWAAAGHSHSVFATTYDDLLTMTAGTPVEVV